MRTDASLGTTAARNWGASILRARDRRKAARGNYLA